MLLGLRHLRLVKGERHSPPEAEDALLLAAVTSSCISYLSVCGLSVGHAKAIGLIMGVVRPPRLSAAGRNVRLRETRLSFP